MFAARQPEKETARGFSYRFGVLLLAALLLASRRCGQGPPARRVRAAMAPATRGRPPRPLPRIAGFCS